MARAGSVIPVRLSRRMCLSCGYDGRALQDGATDTVWACPRCGSDLYARPPRSYAELEGLSDSAAAPWQDAAAGGRDRVTAAPGAAYSRGVGVRAGLPLRWGWLVVWGSMGVALAGAGFMLGMLI